MADKPKNKEWTTVKVSVRIPMAELKRIVLSEAMIENPTREQIRKVRMEDIQLLFAKWCEANAMDY
jgi:hypothetical protein